MFLCWIYTVIISALIMSPVEECRVLWSSCLYVSESIHSHISITTCPYFTKFSVHVTYGCGLVLSWQQCNILCTSSFVDGIMFSHNGPNTDTGHWQIIHCDSPCGAGGEVCYSWIALLWTVLLTCAKLPVCQRHSNYEVVTLIKLWS